VKRGGDGESNMANPIKATTLYTGKERGGKTPQPVRVKTGWAVRVCKTERPIGGRGGSIRDDTPGLISVRDHGNVKNISLTLLKKQRIENEAGVEVLPFAIGGNFVGDSN